jgi:nucleolar protein 12
MLTPPKAGAVKTPPKARYAELPPQRSTTPPEDEDASEDELSEGSESGGAALDAEDSEDNNDDDEVMEDGDASDVSMDDEAEAAAVLEKAVARAPQDEARKRKRKQRDDNEDLEAKYFERLENEDEPTGKRRKADSTEKDASAVSKGDSEQSIVEEDDGESADEVPVHESLATPAATAATPAVTELEKANRTVFLSNVSVEAITSGKAKKTLLSHLASVLDKEAKPAQKVESIRFRSTAFETAAIPKRAAYIKKDVLSATTRSTNAYAVYSTTAAARVAVAQLNGTVVLDRHLRVDSVAHPAPVDHRRCVFVGNLGFVDDETVYNTKVTEGGKEVTEKRKRTKAPMDVEEGLWQVFGKEGGKVESVRVVRDAATRVGKGFAYVQFYVSLPLLLPPTQTNPLKLTPTTGRQLGRIRHPPQRQEIPAHAPPRAARHALQGPPQDRPRHGSPRPEAHLFRRPQGQGRRQIRQQEARRKARDRAVRPQAHRRVADPRRPRKQTARPLRRGPDRG